MTIDDLFDTLVRAPAYGRSELQQVAILLLCLGLLFTWLGDLAIGWIEPRVPLGERQRGWLALAAPYFVVHRFRRRDLGGLRPLGRREVRRFLRADWEITDRATAMVRLDNLARSGHRRDPRFADTDAVDGVAPARALLAWDAVRLVFVSRCAFAVGCLDADTALSFMRAGCQLARSELYGWDELGRAFVAGRTIWGGAGTDRYRRVVEKLLRDPGSEWSRHPWDRATAT